MLSFINTVVNASGRFIPPRTTVLSVKPFSLITFSAVVNGDPPIKSPRRMISSSPVIGLTASLNTSANSSAVLPFSNPTAMTSFFSPANMLSALANPFANSPWLTSTTYFIFLLLL